MSSAPESDSPLRFPHQENHEFLISRHHLPGLLIQSSTPPPKNHVRRPSATALHNPHMRYMRLIGNSNPRYQWEQYRKSPEELKKMKPAIRKYYQRINSTIDRYIYVDNLLDSTLPRDLLQTYNPPETINESVENGYGSNSDSAESLPTRPAPLQTLKKRPSYLYRIADEESPLLGDGDNGGSAEQQAKIVKLAIYVNLAANTLLLIAKLWVAYATSSLSVVASLVDGALDFLSTAIVWTTTRLIEDKDRHSYPIGRSRLEPVGVLIFSVIMVTSFVQVGLEGIQRLFGADHGLVSLGPAAIGIMASTVVVKGACYIWCRMIRNSSVQALAQDALTDVVFNASSIFFPLLGFYLKLWWADALGGLLLSIYVIVAWAAISKSHIKNLTGAAASADEQNVLLYLTMRFAKSIKQITSVQAYHAGDQLNVEVDIVLDGMVELRDSHDLGESLQYVLEGLGIVDRAFVHLDYDSMNPPGHLR